MPKVPFKEGDSVMANWPGSSLWYHATVLQRLEDGYEVKFEDGTEYDLDENKVLKESYFRRSRSRSRSPSRRRSRSRSPARSPARKPTKKTEASPARKEQTVTRTQTRSVKKTTVVKADASKQEEVVKKAAEAATPYQKVVETQKAPPRRLIVPVSDISNSAKKESTVTRTETRSYTTRSSTRTGKQILEPPIDLQARVFVSKTKHYEFGGPYGVSFLMLLLPLLVYYLYFTCTEEDCKPKLRPGFSTNWREYFDLEAFCIMIGWILFHVIVYFIPVGKIVQGLPLRTGRRLKYYENAFFALLLSLGGFGLLVYFKQPYTLVVDKFLPLITASVIVSLLLSIHLYVKSLKAPNNELAPLGNSGCVPYDFFMGHELNPRFGMLDLKYFFELRPGLIGWIVIDCIFLFKMWPEFPSKPPLPLLILTVFHTIYVADALWNESAILSTMDIISEGFGFMLAFGDLVWVPFIFTIQARYLSLYPQDIPNYCLAIIIVMNLVGYYIFRTANSEKHEFRKNPYSAKVSHLQTITTDSGKKLIVSGWWGYVRRPNYLGDIIMAFSWAFLCGFQSVIPYFYPVYLLILLVSREYRDSNICKQKYGSHWDKYCKRVKYRIFPYIY